MSCAAWRFFPTIDQHRISVSWLKIAALMCVVLLGCVAAPHKLAPQLSSPNASPATPPTSPSIVREDVEGKLYITGLPPNLHGFVRGTLLLLDNPLSIQSSQGHRVFAVATVVESYRESARIQVLCQRGPGRVVGLRAHLYDPGGRRLAGRCAGSLLERQGFRVRIDLGSMDQVEVGSRYRVLDRDHLQECGSLRITQVQDQSAWATVTGDGDASEVQPGQIVVFHQNAKDADSSHKDALTILVVNFAAVGSDIAERKLAESGAHQLAQALNRSVGALAGIRVKYLQDATVTLTASDGDGHAQARVLGRKHGAHLVIWGIAQCSVKACLLPRFTVVDPGRLQRSELLGMRLPIDKDDYGFTLRDSSTPPEALELAAAILGQLAFRGQKYDDAAYYLQRAMRSQALTLDDQMRMQWWASYALFTKGQTESARTAAQALVAQAEKTHKVFWRSRGLLALARVEARTGDISSSRRHLEEVLHLSEVTRDEEAAADALNALAHLAAQQGHINQASEMYQRSLRLSQQSDNVKGEATTLHALAGLMVQQGRLSEAQALYQRSLILTQQLGDLEGEAATLHQLAVVESQQGQDNKAQKLYQRALELERQIGDVQGEAATMRQMAFLETQQGHVEYALTLFRRSLAISRQIGDVEGQATTLYELAVVTAQKGQVDEAQTLYRHSLELIRQVGDVPRESATLRRLAMLDAQQGRVEAAITLYRRSLELIRQVGDVSGESATLHNLATLETQQGRVAEAQNLYRLSLALKRQIGDVKGEAATLHALGALEASQGRLTEALSLYRRSLALKKQIGDVQGEAVSLNNIALILQNTGNLSEAVKLYQSARESFDKIGDIHSKSSVEYQLALLDVDKKNYSSARITLNKVISVAISAGDTRLQADAERLLGIALLSLKEETSAKILLQHAIFLYEKIELAEEAIQTKAIMLNTRAQ